VEPYGPYDIESYDPYYMDHIRSYLCIVSKLFCFPQTYLSNFFRCDIGTYRAWEARFLFVIGFASDSFPVGPLIISLFEMTIYNW